MKPTEDPRQSDFEDHELDEMEKKYNKQNEELEKIGC